MTNASIVADLETGRIDKADAMTLTKAMAKIDAYPHV